MQTFFWALVWQKPEVQNFWVCQTKVKIDHTNYWTNRRKKIGFDFFKKMKYFFQKIFLIPFFEFFQNLFLLLDSQINLLCISRTSFDYFNKLSWGGGPNKPLMIILKKGFWANFFLGYHREWCPTSRSENCFFLSSRVFLVQSLIFYKIKILTNFTAVWQTKYWAVRFRYLKVWLPVHSLSNGA